jgi:SAM-dependent methyltransferase
VTGPADEAMEAEFDVVARWTEEAVRLLGPDHAIPAGCRGSASPGGLAWLGEACELATGARLLDAGGGVGGPAAYAALRFGVQPVLVEPMLGACRAAVHLFGLTAVVGAGQRLPVATGAVDAVWCLGVLCTTEDKPALVRELRRVLPRGGPLGLLVFTARRGRLPDPPQGNAFPTDDEVARLLDDSGFDLVQQLDAAEVAATPLSWTERIEAVDRVIADAHGDDPRFALALDQEQRVARLLDEGRVAGRLVHAVAR